MVISLAAAELLGDLGISTPPHAVIKVMVMAQPIFGSACLGAFAVYLYRLRPRGPVLWSVVVTGLGLEALLWWRRASFMGLEDRIDCIGVGLGTVAMVACLVQAFGADDELRRKAIDAITIGSLIPLMYIFGCWAMGLIDHFTPVIFDLYGYAIDAVRGFSPTLTLAALVTGVKPLKLVADWVYLSLPLFLVATRLVNEQHPRRAYADVISAFAILGLVGTMLYMVFPMVGLRTMLGNRFPRYPLPGTFTPHPIHTPRLGARNCMPSLHMAWMMTALWCVRGSGRGYFWSSLPVGLLMVCGMVARGGHYIIDLVVGLALGLGVLGLTAYPRPENRGARALAAAWGLGLTGTSLTLLRLAPTALIHHPWGTVAGELFIVLSCLRVEQLLFRRSTAGLDSR